MLLKRRLPVVPGEVSPEQVPERIRKGLARHPIPLMVLARLAVAVDHQGQGLGAALLKDLQGIVAKQPWVSSPPGEGCGLDPSRSLSTEAGICG